jgi:hypothetical protein
VPIYDKRFTHEEIKEILAFQQSAVGKKLNGLSIELSMEIVMVTNAYIKRLQENQKLIEGDSYPEDND